jgi:hypothetical protein
MSENFIRKYQLTIEGAAGKGVIIRGQQIEFDITRTSKSKLNELDLKIYNLSKETISIFSTVDAVVKLEVGYRDTPLATIFRGNKIHCATTREGENLITRVLVCEGAVTTREARTQSSLPAHTKVRDVISKIVKESMPEIKVLNMNGEGLDKTYPRGYSTSGSAKKTLDDVCNTNNLKWHIIHNDTINVFPINGDIKTKAIVITPTMIKNTPEQTTTELKDLKKDLDVPKKTGLNLTLQMNPLFKEGGLIKVEGTFNSDGTYIIQEIKHSGNFEGDTWDTRLECSNYN